MLRFSFSRYAYTGRTPVACAVAVAAMCLVLCTASVAQSTEAKVVRVEEDWELVVGTPNPNTDSPQVTCIIAPQGDVSGLYCALDLNVRGTPSFSPGGLQLQIWEGDLLLASKDSNKEAIVTETGEVVTWTQSMQLDTAMVTFEITNGNSTTWGAFGGQGYLKAKASWKLGSLDSYCPSVSAQYSGVGYGSNRVESLKLKAVRVLMSSGETVEYTEVITVHPKN